MVAIGEFIQHVKKMRNAQKAWFRTHDYNYLQESKDLEKECDKMLKELETPPTPTLFD